MFPLASPHREFRKTRCSRLTWLWSDEFRKPGSQDEYYDIDFWVDQKSGKLEVKDVKMHKVPVQEDGVWTQVPRYTFDKDTFDVTN